MENLIYLINVLDHDRRYLANIVKQKSDVFKSKRSKKKPPSLIGNLSQKITKVSLNLNREIIGGPK